MPVREVFGSHLTKSKLNS